MSEAAWAAQFFLCSGARGVQPVLAYEEIGAVLVPQHGLSTGKTVMGSVSQKHLGWVQMTPECNNWVFPDLFCCFWNYFWVVLCIGGAK